MVELPWPLITQGGATGLLALFIVAILTGRLMPAAVVRSIKDDRDQWRETALEREQTIARIVDTVHEANESSKLVLEIISELRDNVDGGPSSRE